MIRTFAFFVRWLCVAGVLAATGHAWGLTVTDGVTTKVCTSYTVSTDGNVLTLKPDGCLVSTANDPVFSIRIVPTSIVQPSTAGSGAQRADVFVDVDRDLPAGATYGLTLHLCTAAQNCAAANGAWYMFRYAELGGQGFLPQHQVTTGSFDFTFTPGANTSPANPRSMGVGYIEMPSATLFPGVRSVTFGVAMRNMPAANVATLQLTGGAQAGAGIDYDINGNLIPNTAHTNTNTSARACEYPAGSSGFPGPNPTNPCGAYQIPVGDCSSGMTGANEIKKAYLLQVKDIIPGITNYTSGDRNPWFGLPRDVAFVFKFKTGPAGSFPAFPYPLGLIIEEQVPHGANAPRFASVSEKRCDFDYNKLPQIPGAPNPSLCYQAAPVVIALQAQITRTGSDPSLPAIQCQLKPDTYYYFSMRWEDPVNSRGVISCNPGAGSLFCGSVLQIQQ